MSLSKKFPSPTKAVTSYLEAKVLLSEDCLRRVGMGVGERSEALLNIKAMGEKMLSPSCEPGLVPPPQPFPTTLFNSNENLALHFPVRPGSIRSIETRVARAWNPDPG